MCQHASRLTADKSFCSTPCGLNLICWAAAARFATRALIFVINSSNWTRNSARLLDSAGADLTSVTLSSSFQRFEQCEH